MISVEVLGIPKTYFGNPAHSQNPPAVTCENVDQRGFGNVGQGALKTRFPESYLLSVIARGLDHHVRYPDTRGRIFLPQTWAQHSQNPFALIGGRP